MTQKEMLDKVCLGNRAAFDFLVGWGRYCDEVDNIVDGERFSREEVLATAVFPVQLFTAPFFLQHLQELRAVVVLVASMYGEANAWERSSEAWEREMAEVYRVNASVEMVLAVARLCGGWAHGRAVAAFVRRSKHAEDQAKEQRPTATGKGN